MFVLQDAKYNYKDQYEQFKLIVNAIGEFLKCLIFQLQFPKYPILPFYRSHFSLKHFAFRFKIPKIS